MSTFTIGILGFLLMLLLLFLSMPVGFVMAVVGCVGFAAVTGNLPAALHLTLSVTYDTFSKYDYSVIPLFIFMGQVAFHSGISRRLFDAAYCWLGRLPGGLGVAAVGACAAFGSICGSGPATAATGRVFAPWRRGSGRSPRRPGCRRQSAPARPPTATPLRSSSGSALRAPFA